MAEQNTTMRNWFRTTIEGWGRPSFFAACRSREDADDENRPSALLNLCFLVRRDDSLDVGQDGILRPIGNRPVVDFSKTSADRLTIGRRLPTWLPTCPTFAAKPHCATDSRFPL